MYQQLAKAIIAAVGIGTVSVGAVVFLAIRSYNSLVLAGVDPRTASLVTLKGGGLRCLVGLIGSWVFLCLLYPSLWDTTVEIMRGLIRR